MTWVQENAEALKRQTFTNQAPQLSAGGTGLEQGKPLVHYLEIEAGKRFNVIGSFRRQVVR